MSSCFGQDGFLYVNFGKKPLSPRVYLVWYFMLRWMGMDIHPFSKVTCDIQRCPVLVTYEHSNCPQPKSEWKNIYCIEASLIFPCSWACTIWYYLSTTCSPLVLGHLMPLGTSLHKPQKLLDFNRGCVHCLVINWHGNLFEKEANLHLELL